MEHSVAPLKQTIWGQLWCVFILALKLMLASVSQIVNDMLVRNFSVRTVEDLEIQLQAQTDYFSPALAIAFGDSSLDFSKIVAAFKRRDIKLVGCSTAGEIYNDQISSGSISIMLLDIAKESFITTYLPGTGSDYTLVGKTLARIAIETFTNPGFLLYIGGLGVDGHSVICGMRTELKDSVPIFGGMAGDDLRFEKLRVFNEKGVYDNGVTALILDCDQIDIVGYSYSGWNELGMLHQVTKCDGNVLYEIDNKPALELFNRYFRNLTYREVVKNRQGSDVSDVYTTPGVFALSIKRNDGTAFMRSTLMFDFHNKALILAGGIQDGDSFRFCPTPSLEVIDDTIDVISELHKGNSKPKAVIMNSCAARLAAFGPLLEDEIEGIRSIMDAPMVGLMAYGEIGRRTPDEPYGFHNVTCSVVNISEKA